MLIDFSAPDALRASLDRAVSAGVPLLIGTTGLIDEHDALIAEAAKAIPILKAPNTSLGVALLADLTERAARILGPEAWDIEIVEAHHNKKADAPSGTALHLGASADRGRGGELTSRARARRHRPEAPARRHRLLLRSAAARSRATMT